MPLYLVTGASSGIGEALCRELVRRGQRVIGIARRAERLQEIASELAAPSLFVPLPCDVSRRDELRSALDALTEVPDCVILCAGLGQFDSRKAFDATLHERTFATNYFGPIWAVEALLQRFFDRGSGTFVAVSSLAAWHGSPKSIAYSASKAALSSAFESMRLTWSRSPIRFVRVHPGFVKTPMTSVNGYMPFLLEPGQAARIILAGIEGGKKDINFPWQMALLFSLVRWLPDSLYIRLTG